MQLFDLNIPYLESDKSISDKSSKKQTRLKLIVKAMELGYSGIAYNRTIKGAMSESDRCTISPFPLSSLLSHSPSLAATVSFHRRLLKVPQKGAFRQYTRLTMFVETSAQASALNSGNLILKTYDLIAVTPLNQTCFDIACQSSQVDLISIDFGDKLPFRLKLPMVKAALARGVYFEIMYSSLLQDVQLRRQMISNAKLLVEWTRGKNLIVSSAASSTLELRGPNDVANLLSLLGLSNECAKATISKNCRLLISNTLRQKQFYKEAIRVEKMPSGVQTDPKEPWIVDHLDWDLLSIGEGDLLLDDMAKAFSESGKISRVAKSIVSSSIVDPVQSHGVQVDDIGFRTQGKLGMFSDFISISSSKDLEVSKMTEKTQNGPTSLCSSLLDQSENAIEDSQQVIHSDSPMVCTNVEDSSIHSSVSVLEKSYDVLETTTTLDHISNVDNVLLSDGMKEVTSTDDGLDLGYIVGSRKEFLSKYEGFDCGGAQTDSLKLASGSLNRTEAGVSTELEFHDQSDLSLCPDISFSGNLLKLKEDPFLHGKNLMDLDSVIDRNSSALLLGDQQSLESVVETKEKKEDETEVKLEIQESLVLNSVMSFDPLQQEKDVNDLLISKSMLSDDHGMMECIKQVLEIGEAEYKSLSPKNLGNHNVKRQYRGQIPRFPFKRLLQVQFKKKGRASMYKTKKRSV